MGNRRCQMAFPTGRHNGAAPGGRTTPPSATSWRPATSTRANQCRQENTATNTQTATATAGAGGTATGGNAGPVQVVGDGAEGGSYGGNAYANGGDAEAYNSLENEQSNQISGRDSSRSPAPTGTAATTPPSATSWPPVTRRATTSATRATPPRTPRPPPRPVVPAARRRAGTPAPSRSSVTTQRAARTEATRTRTAATPRRTTASRTSSRTRSPGATARESGSDGEGNNNSAVCNQLATGDTWAPTSAGRRTPPRTRRPQPRPVVPAARRPAATPAPSQVVGDDAEGGSYGGNAYANGGDAEASNSLENEQSNQISGRDSSGSGYGWDGNNNSAICNQLATGNAFGDDQCHQSNTATNTQSATATGGAGGSATGGNAGPSQVVGDGSRGRLIRRQRVRERRRRRVVQQPRERAVEPDLRPRQPGVAPAGEVEGQEVEEVQQAVEVEQACEVEGVALRQVDAAETESKRDERRSRGVMPIEHLT